MKLANTSVRAEVNLNYTNIGHDVAAHPLKGFLMDKGELASARLLSGLEQKTKLFVEAMQGLVEEHKHMTQEYGCNHLRLHLVYEDRKCTGVGQGNKRIDPRVVDAALKASCTLVWLANKSLANRCGGAVIVSKRVSPFSPDQQDYDAVSTVLRVDAPAYYQAIAVVENLRLSLNSGYKAVRNLAIDSMRVNYEAGLADLPYFTSKTRKAAEVLMGKIDASGQVSNSLKAFFSEV